MGIKINTYGNLVRIWNKLVRQALYTPGVPEHNYNYKAPLWAPHTAYMYNLETGYEKDRGDGQRQ